jgi:phage terminase large subunit-like protein
VTDTLSKARADKALRFIRNLTQPKDKWAGAPFNPRPWQETVIRELFGRVREDDANRRAYRTCYIEIPRKNGKTTLAAAFGLYGLIGDGVQGAEVYMAANDREQASLVFDAMAQMVNRDPQLSARLKVLPSQKRIVDHKTGSVARAISAEAYSKHGFNASMVIYDELHAAKDRDLWDVLLTSMGARWEPLLVAITTAGYDRHSICWEQHDYASKILDGTVTDATFYPVIYAAKDDDEWTDEAVWKKANPALEDFRDIEEMRAMAARAREIPAQQNTFRRLYLNQWTEQAERWIDMAAWDRCDGEMGWKQLREEMKGKPCMAGLDLSSRIDLTALMLTFEIGDKVVAVPFFWVPEEGMHRRSRTDRVPYDEWTREGLIEATPGAVVDQERIRQRINELGKEYKIRELAYDPWNATKITSELSGDGFAITEVRWGPRDLSEPTKHMGALVVGGTLVHGGHPLLRWMAANSVAKQDANGNLMLDKAKANGRIDGMAALSMAIAAMLRHVQEPEPVYPMFFVGGRA